MQKKPMRSTTNNKSYQFWANSMILTRKERQEPRWATQYKDVTNIKAYSSQKMISGWLKLELNISAASTIFLSIYHLVVCGFAGKDTVPMSGVLRVIWFKRE